MTTTPEQQRAMILERHAASRCPHERQRLRREWLEAGGKELLDDALRRGLEALKAPR